MTKWDEIGEKVGIDLENAQDIIQIMESDPRLKVLPPAIVEGLWNDFSDSYCATWLMVDSMMIDQFHKWMDGKI